MNGSEDAKAGTVMSQVDGDDIMKRVLVVEDDELFRRSLCGYVSALGYEPVSAESAERAMELCATTPVDLILTDYQLISSNGIDLILALRNACVSVPSVLISGYLSEEVRNRAASLQVAAILRKPTDLGRLPELLPALLGEATKP